MKAGLFLFLSLFLTFNSLSAENSELCLYFLPNGQSQQVNSRAAVPAEYRSKARCFSNTARPSETLAKPEEVSLEGNVRRDSFSSPLGIIHLRWPRKVETLFGRNPMRAVNDAASTVSRALRQAAFPQKLQSLKQEWQIIFMDENMPETQIPMQLISNCHPGWMTPPANIYIVADRVAAGCGSRERVNLKQADAMLSEVMVHEMGHAVEFQLLGPRFQGNRMRAEGFATWFEGYAAKYSSLLDASEIRNKQLQQAAMALRTQPYFQFRGTGEDYARASLYFAAVEKKQGIRGLIALYQHMATSGEDLLPAIQTKLGWNEQRLTQEMAKLLKN